MNFFNSTLWTNFVGIKSIALKNNTNPLKIIELSEQQLVFAPSSYPN